MSVDGILHPVDIPLFLCYPCAGNRTAVRFERIDRGLFTCRRGRVFIVGILMYIANGILPSSGGWGFRLPIS